MAFWLFCQRAGQTVMRVFLNGLFVRIRKSIAHVRRQILLIFAKRLLALTKRSFVLLVAFHSNLNGKSTFVSDPNQMQQKTGENPRLQNLMLRSIHKCSKNPKNIRSEVHKIFCRTIANLPPVTVNGKFIEYVIYQKT